jgi:tetratricopeptide (TPR) repeat protein
MREVVRRHPDDLDVATLFAESLMDLNPWKHWTPEGEPVAETPEIVATLESVLERHANHPGAIHLYIHAVEASPHPEKAEAAADRLRFLVPAAGHLVHMPSHIYIRVGRYADAFDLNERAAAADESFLAWCRSPGLYRALYYPHNLHFIWSAASFDGRRDAALAAARKLVAQIPPAYEEFPFLEDFVPTPTFTMLRFGMWDAVLAEPAPPATLRYATGIHHYARGLARLRLGDSTGAAEELRTLDAIAAEPALEKLMFFGGSAAQNLHIASRQLAGEVAAARRDWEAAVAHLEEAVRLQDALAYTEPPPWYLPERQVLGAVLLDAGRAKEAEAVYRRDLEIHPRNGWSLFGLARSLEAQGSADAEWAEQGFAHAWVRSDVTLEASRF